MDTTCERPTPVPRDAPGHASDPARPPQNPPMFEGFKKGSVRNGIIATVGLGITLPFVAFAHFKHQNGL